MNAAAFEQKQCSNPSEVIIVFINLCTCLASIPLKNTKWFSGYRSHALFNQKDGHYVYTITFLFHWQKNERQIEGTMIRDPQ